LSFFLAQYHIRNIITHITATKRIKAITQPAIITPTSLPPSLLCSLVPVGGVVTIKATLTVELRIVVELRVVAELVAELRVVVELRVVAELVLAVELRPAVGPTLVAMVGVAITAVLKVMVILMEVEIVTIYVYACLYIYVKLIFVHCTGHINTAQSIVSTK